MKKAQLEEAWQDEKVYRVTAENKAYDFKKAICLAIGLDLHSSESATLLAVGKLKNQLRLEGEVRSVAEGLTSNTNDKLWHLLKVVVSQKEVPMPTSPYTGMHLIKEDL